MLVLTYYDIIVLSLGRLGDVPETVFHIQPRPNGGYYYYMYNITVYTCANEYYNSIWQYLLLYIYLVLYIYVLHTKLHRNEVIRTVSRDREHPSAAVLSCLVCFSDLAYPILEYDIMPEQEQSHGGKKQDEIRPIRQEHRPRNARLTAACFDRSRLSLACGK